MEVLASTMVFCVIAGLALLLDYLTTLAPTYATGFLAVIIGATQYALLTADIALWTKPLRGNGELSAVR